MQELAFFGYRQPFIGQGCSKLRLSKFLYMSFDSFLLAVESRDLTQADKSVIRVSSFSILQNFNFWTIRFIVILKTTI